MLAQQHQWEGSQNIRTKGGQTRHEQALERDKHSRGWQGRGASEEQVARFFWQRQKEASRLGMQKSREKGVEGSG